MPSHGSFWTSKSPILNIDSSATNNTLLHESSAFVQRLRGGTRWLCLEPCADRILDATECLLTRLGYRKMTMDDVAQEAGIGKRTIYVHFPSKEEVALASIDRVVDRLTTRLRELAARRWAAGPAAAADAALPDPLSV